jgi:predicted kinase
VRRCHGDLHLRNIFLLDGRPTLFDAVEFNPDIACIDVLYDAAFLFMDLWRRDLRDEDNAAFNAYLTATGDISGLPLLPLFLSCRAAVRAKTNATAARLQSDVARRREAEGAARDYLEMAGALLSVSPARLVAIGGFSGSGKSTLARSLAPRLGAVPGALIVRSDVERKALFGVQPDTPLGPDGYSTQVTARVYRRLVRKAVHTTRTGHSAIADAVFARLADRQDVEHAAEAAGVRFTGLWLEASADVLAERVRRRSRDASDATVDVLKRQLAQDPGPIDWHRLDAAGDEGAVLSAALERLADPKDG